MKSSDQTDLRVDVLRRLRLVYGIKVKINTNEHAEGCKTPARAQIKVFGVPLHHLQMINVSEYGLVPRFLVDSCKHLLKYIDCEGLFRKSGSVVRMKALKARLDEGENCFSAAMPSDVASLVKQFFRDLPCPVVPVVLLRAFVRAQMLPTEEQRTTASQLVSCLLPEVNSSTLCYFLSFLKQVSLRPATAIAHKGIATCTFYSHSHILQVKEQKKVMRCLILFPELYMFYENKMDSNNLSVVISPSLFHLHSTPEWNDARYRLHIAVTCTLIENADSFGVVPDTIAEIDCSVLNSIRSSRGRESLEVTLLSTSGTLCSKEKMIWDSAYNESPHRKRKSFRHSIGMVPSVLFGCCYNSKSEQQHSSPSAVLNRRLSNSGRHRGCGRVCKNMKRVVSGALGCVTSDSGEKSLSQSPTSSCWLHPYQDTPVGICSNRHQPQQESAPSKPSQITQVFRRLFCTSTENQEEQQFLTLNDTTSCNQSTVSVGLQTPLTKNVSATSCLEMIKTNVCEPKEEETREKELIFPIEVSNSELQSTQAKNEHVFPDDGHHNGIQIQVIDCAKVSGLRDLTPTSNTSTSRPVGRKNVRIPVIKTQKITNVDTCRVHLIEQTTYSTKLVNSKITTKIPKVKVLDYVRKYDKLHVKAVTPKTVKSPIKFKRTPVYQYVKRINSQLTKRQMLK